MIGKYKVITLCGSTKFNEEFLKEQERLTLEGNIVLSVVMFTHQKEGVFSEVTKKMLDDMHKRKIDISDEIFVINIVAFYFYKSFSPLSSLSFIILSNFSFILMIEIPSLFKISSTLLATLGYFTET